MGILILCMLFTGLGGLLGFAGRRFRVEGNPLAQRVDALLPQIQCGQCGYPGCLPYAEAIVRGDAEIDQCPPGGDDTVRSLAGLLGRDVKPTRTAQGGGPPKRIAVIAEEQCIGCTLCIQACPVDAIVGAPGLMHTVIASECTGCELCVAPCPVDCVGMSPALAQVSGWRWSAPSAPEKR